MIYFDIDDTLLDYKSSQDAAALQFARQYMDAVEDQEKFPVIWEQVTQRHIARYLSGEISFQEQRRCRVRESLGKELSPQAADSAFEDYYKMYEASWSLFPEVREVLAGLSPYRLGIITNGDEAHQKYKLEKFGLLGCFEFIITPASTGFSKPRKEIFQFAAEQASKHVSECWYIGDNFQSDYHGARNAGFNSVWLNRTEKKELCDNQSRSLSEFLIKIQLSGQSSE